MKSSFAGVTGALLLAAIATQAQASAAWVAKGEYLCSVAEVSSFDEDKAGIIEAALRKSYLITVDSKRVYVTELDSERQSSQDIYTIVQRGFYGNDIYAVRNTMDSLAAVALTEFHYEGHYGATLFTQSPYAAHAWKLRCQK